MTDEVTVLLGTWNLNNLKAVTDSLQELLQVGKEQHDIFAIGTQEFDQPLSKWKAALEEAVFSTHVAVHAQELAGIKLVVLIRKDLQQYISKIESADLPTKLGGLMKTKGGVGISFTLGATSFLFINSHLAAHQTKVADRNADYGSIVHNLELPLDFSASKNLGLLSSRKRASSRMIPIYEHYDRSFWMGDLNYRIDLPRAEVIEHVSKREWDVLLAADQLIREKGAGRVFQGYEEAPIAFPPTYKFDRGTDE